MPIRAKTKMTISDDCLEEPPYIILNYSGPNPQDIYEEIKNLLRIVFKVSEEEIQEKEFFWDRSAAEEKFRVTIDALKDLDKATHMHISISLNGNAKPSKEFGKEGSATIRIEGALHTEYALDTLWQKSILGDIVRAFYHKFIYQEKREGYKERCRASLNRFFKELKSFLNLLPKRA